MGKTAAKGKTNTDKKAEDAEVEDEDELEPDDVETDDESEEDDQEEGKEEPKPQTKSDYYWKRQNDKLKKENADLKAAQAKTDKELAAERKKLESRAEVEKYDSVLEKLEEAGLPTKARKLIDLSWSDERIDEAIEGMKELADSKAKTTDRRKSEDDDAEDDDEEEEPTRQPKRRTRQPGEDRPDRRDGKKLRDLSSITDPTKRLNEAAKDI